MRFDLVVRGGRIVTAGEEFVADIGIRDGRIEAIGCDLPSAPDEIDAADRWVLPGGIDAHCHIEEPAYQGAINPDDFATASIAAACGGTTTIVPFLNQQDGVTLEDAFHAYRSAAEARSILDFSFHVLLKDARPETISTELPAMFARGLRSVKIFMTYPGYMMTDTAMLDVMAAVAAVDGIVMVHAEIGEASRWNVDRLASAGRTGLSNFAKAYPVLIEREATHRAISLAELTGARLLVVHVSSADALEQIAWAKRRALPVLAETCPQYLLGVGDRLDSDEWETAKLICAPPIRGARDSEALWRGLAEGSLDIVSSDHCPYLFDSADGKKAHDGVADFRDVPCGLPGIETRLPLLFEGVADERISIRRFVELTATRPAMIYGLYPRKGIIAPGADADLAIWEVGQGRPLRHADLHDRNDHSPFEGKVLRGRPVTTLVGGRRVWDAGEVLVRPGGGRFITPSEGPRC
jgi:dihydropyrimidinase